MNPDVLASYTQNIGQGKENYSRINAVYSGPLHPALHRNGAWPAPPGVTSERRLARSTRRYIGTALRGALYSLSYLFFFVTFFILHRHCRAGPWSQPLPLLFIHFKTSKLQNLLSCLKFFPINWAQVRWTEKRQKDSEWQNAVPF